MTETAFRVRPARSEDLDALYALALQTGGGFTNLPADRPALAERLERSAASFGDPTGGQAPWFILMLEDIASGRAVGTATIFSRIGVEQPFYSYRRIRLSQASAGLCKTLRSELLHLVNDFDGCSEVGGLFLDPAWRGGRSGRLLARSRYLFIAQMRDRFAQRVIAELRGHLTADGRSPFWNAIGAHFFDMPFDEADRLNSLTGNQFIADLMPRHPIYIQLLPAEAQAVIGAVHPEGAPAYSMLMEEGFRDDGYVDIFDGGPTVHADIDSLKAVRDSRTDPVAGFIENGHERADDLLALVGAGRCAGFRAARGRIRLEPDGACLVSRGLAEALSVGQGDLIRHVAF
jgi:arginine N-succinyltransferase